MSFVMIKFVCETIVNVCVFKSEKALAEAFEKMTGVLYTRSSLGACFTIRGQQYIQCFMAEEGEKCRFY